MKRLIILLLLLPLRILAGDYELQIQVPSDKTDKINGKYVFDSKAEYYEAQVAYDNLLKLNHELSKNEDEQIPREIRYQNYLAKLNKCRQAHIALESALSKGSKK